jgi:putative PIN family toxin of toxin-antitoxin system
VRVILDTNVVVSGLLWGGEPRQLLLAAHTNRVELFTSTTLLLELSDILGRTKFAHKIAAAQLSTDQIVERYALLASVVHPADILPVVIDDPDDDHVLACALAAKADVIVSGDRHLLDLKEYQGMRIVRVTEVLGSI